MSRFQFDLLELGGSESGDELDGFLGTKQFFGRQGPKSKQQQQQQQQKQRLQHAMPPARRARGRPAATNNNSNKVTKPKSNSSARRNSGRLAAAVEHAEERAVLTEKSTNSQSNNKPRGRGRKAAAVAAAAAANTDEDAASQDEDEEVAPASPRPASPAKPKATRGRPKKTTATTATTTQVNQDDAGADGPAARPTAAKRGRKPAAERKDAEIPEAQQAEPAPEEDAMDVDVEESRQDEEDPPEDDYSEPAMDSPPPRLSPTDHVVPRSASQQPHEGGGGEPALRRRLGELTKKHESLEARHRDLRNVAVRDTDANFDKLKKTFDDRASAADQLVAGLRAEVAAQKVLAREGQAAKGKLQACESRVDDLQARVDETAKLLAESRAENKSLSIKLAAARNAEAAAAAAASRAPGGGGVGGAAGQKQQQGEAIQQATAMQMKEDLYGDLTGLIVRGVKKDGGENVFDCIQTGRNGTLHFKLSISNDTASEKYEEAQYQYMPQLDPSRDCELINLLPDYLVEEISFPRTHAAKFYARVIKALNELPEE